MGSWVEKQQVVKTRNGGFTLLELLVAIVIIGVLTAIAVPIFLGQRDNAYAASLQSDVANAAKTIEGTYVEGSGYATTASYEVGAGNTVEYCLLESGQAFGVVGVSDNTDQKFYYSSADGGSVTINVCLGQTTDNGGTGGASAPAASAPAAPGSLTAVAGNAQVILEWLAPENNGATITDYVVQYRTSAGPGEWATFDDGVSDALAATVTGLANGTAYDFQVAATNSAGTGSYSNTATAAPFGPLSLEYSSSTFTTGSNNQVLSPSVSGGSGSKTYAITDGTLPAGVTFNTTNGTFTGPAGSAWNFAATQISAGYNHSCALTTSGGVKCWGWNEYGQLGDGTTTNRSTPVDVSGLTSGVASISTGVYHTCAVTTSGGVKCWGDNGYGQLGDGTTTDRTTPVDVSRTGPQPGFPASLTVTVTDSSGTATATPTLSQS